MIEYKKSIGKFSGGYFNYYRYNNKVIYHSLVDYGMIYHGYKYCCVSLSKFGIQLYKDKKWEYDKL